MATEQQKYEVLVDRYAAEQASLIEALLRLLLGVWFQFGWWGRPDMVNAAAAASAVHVDAATRRARRMSRAFVLRQLELLDAAPVHLPEIEDAYPRSDAAIVEVYKRPARQTEHLIRQRIKREPETATWTVTDEEWKQFEERLTTIVSDDLAAVARDEAQKVMRAAPKIVGYRRVLHPEFSQTGPCGLCIVAADRFYTKGELMPLHGNCKCTISPVTKNQDLGLKLNADDLARLYAAAGSTYADDLKRITVEVRENGELGPILTRQGENFRDVDQVNRDSKRKTYRAFKQTTPADERSMWEAMRATSERSVSILEAAQADGMNLVDITGRGATPIPIRDIAQAIRWHQSLIARATANLA
ncbi:hypothetical protein [Microbacterium sp. H6]|uniref:hypothetical protein n=1 Tax=Microbacterium sp. H6 TaxID=421122 RepID=UPI000DE3FD58|nr:hypothetical protein [Microbacterium sp. H6]RBO73527.1 hypothetical protein DSP71_05060 [Microbacterium sp. H6]